MQAYQGLVNQANTVAGQPLQQYSGPLVAGFTPDQLSAFNTVRGVQGMAQPYYNQAANYLQSSGQPITPMTFSSDAINSLMSPYIDDVVNATQGQFANQNAQQVAQIQGNAATHGAYGGDREAVVQALTAGQQALAQDPVIANLYNQGYGQALGEFNALNQAQIAAQQATGWLQQGAGSIFANLGSTAQNSALSGADALLRAGTTQQQLEQSRLNIPYQMFQQQQAYPFQTTGWLGNMVMGLGSGMGGTGATTSPGPNALSQIAGLGTAGLGIYGLGNQQGWWGGSGGVSAPTISGMPGAWDAGNLNDFLPAARGGRIERSGGGQVPMGMGIPMGGAGIPDVSLSFVPTAPATGQHSSFINPMQPNTSATQKSDPGILGPLMNIAKIGAMFIKDGGRVGYDIGGPVPPSIGGSSVAPLVHVGTPLLPLGNMPSPVFGQATPQSTSPIYNYAPTFSPNAYPMSMVAVPPDWQPGPPVSIGMSGGILNRPTVPGPTTPTITAPSIGLGGPDMPGVMGNPDDPTMQTGGGGGGWRGGNALHFDTGGSVSSMIPDLSASFIPVLNPNNRRNTIPPPPSPYVPPDPMKNASTLGQSLSSLGKLLKNDDEKAFGGYVDPSDFYRGFAPGGTVSGMQMTAGAGNPLQQGLTSQYDDLDFNQLQALAMRPGSNPMQDAAISRALQIKRMYPDQGSKPFDLTVPSVAGPQAPSLNNPAHFAAATSPISASLAWRGGGQGYAGGGDVGSPVPAPIGAPDPAQQLADKMKLLQQMEKTRVEDRWPLFSTLPLGNSARAEGGSVPMMPASDVSALMNLGTIIGEGPLSPYAPTIPGRAVLASDRMRSELQRRVHPGFAPGGFVGDAALDVPSDSDVLSLPDTGSAFPLLPAPPARDSNKTIGALLRDIYMPPSPTLPARQEYNPPAARGAAPAAYADADLGGTVPAPAFDDFGLPSRRADALLPAMPDYSRAMDKGYAPPPRDLGATPATRFDVGRTVMDPSVPTTAEGRATAAPMSQLSGDYALAVRNGFRGTIQDFAAQNSAAPTLPPISTTTDTDGTQINVQDTPLPGSLAAPPPSVPQITSVPGGTNGIVPGGGGYTPRPTSRFTGQYMPSGSSPARDNVVSFWTTQGGAPPHVAEGIADRVAAESSFRPAVLGDYKDGVPTSGGYYQHHADRLARLKAFAAQQGKPWQDGNVQNQFSLWEVTGGDPIATKHWEEIKNAPDRATAGMLWDRYFERSKYGPGSGTRTYASGISPGYRATVGSEPGEGSGSSMAPAGAGNGNGNGNGVGKPIAIPQLKMPERDRGLGSSPWLALVAAGLGMMASRSPHPGVAIGEGGLSGVKALMDQETLNNRRDLQDMRLQAQQQGITMQGQRLAEQALHHRSAEETSILRTQAQLALVDEKIRNNTATLAEREQQHLLRQQLAEQKAEKAKPTIMNNQYNDALRQTGSWIIPPGADLDKNKTNWVWSPGGPAAGGLMSQHDVEANALRAWTEDQKIVASNPMHKPKSLEEWQSFYQKRQEEMAAKLQPAWAKPGDDFRRIGPGGQIIYYDHQNKTWATPDRKPVS